VCTHNMPNGVQIINSTFQFNFDDYQMIKLTLKDGYKVDALICPSGAKSEKECSGALSVKGTWSTIYD